MKRGVEDVYEGPTTEVQPEPAAPSKKVELQTKLTLLKKARTYHVTEDQTLDMLFLFYARKLQVLQENEKNPGRRKKPAAAQRFVADMLGYSTATVAKAVCEWEKPKEIKKSSGPGNFTGKKTRVPTTTAVIAKVRAFVRGRKKTRQRTVASDVLKFLIGEGYMTVASKSTDWSSATRAVQRFLINYGYKRGRRSSRFSVEETTELVEKRNEYLSVLVENKKLPPDEQLREVYLGESCIPHHYKHQDDSLVDPNDDGDRQPRERHKDKKYCFLAAIQGPDPRVQQCAASDSDAKAGILPGSLWIIEDNSSKSKDYHGNLNRETFLDWFKTHLLQNLKQPSLIIMDGASHHKSVGQGALNLATMRMDGLRRQLLEKGVTPPAKSTRAELIALVKQHFAEAFRPATVRIAEEAGHKVLFIPPFHSELQPIELLWAFVKEDVGRAYTPETSFDKVHKRLLGAFRKVDSNLDLVQSFIGRTNEVVNSFLEDGEVNWDEVVQNQDEDEPLEDNDEAADINDSEGDTAWSNEEDLLINDTSDEECEP